MFLADSLAEHSEAHHLTIVFILTVGMTLAAIFGYLAQKFKLSPIVGYLVAGYLIGPYSPGFVANSQVAEQLAEIGVILMMFGVGLHFRWQDLVKVQGVAIPGAVGQTFVATLATTLLMHAFGMSWSAGIILGLAVGVASTVVLIRVLGDQKLLNTVQGHIAVGWLVVEDIFTVFILVLIPTFVTSTPDGLVSWSHLSIAVSVVILKFVVLIGIMFTIGGRVANYLLSLIARVHSHELFTLSVLAITFLIAAGSSVIFGTSIALGAFIAGMVVGQTRVKHQALAHASPLKDAFLVTFFLSVGMIFNPLAIGQNFPLFMGVLAIVLIIKPLIAIIIVRCFKYSFQTALTVGLALAQIGEFSFILAEEALKFQLITDDAYDILVACALVSICLNPLLFRFFVSGREDSTEGHKIDSQKKQHAASVVLIGVGSSGHKIIKVLKEEQINPLVIDKDLDCISNLTQQNVDAFYGDISVPQVLEVGYLESAKLLILNHLPIHAVLHAIKVARRLQPQLVIIVRLKTDEEAHLIESGDEFVSIYCDEEEGIKRLLQMLKKVPLRLKW